MRPINSSISVDCVIFGFDGASLNVLLIKREQKNGIEDKEDYKLSGSMIYEDETLSQAAYRVLAQTTGLENIYLKQLHVFSDPKRVRGGGSGLVESFLPDKYLSCRNGCLLFAGEVERSDSDLYDAEKSQMGRCAIYPLVGTGP